MASNPSEPIAQWRVLEDGETVQAQANNMQRLRQLGKITFLLVGLLAVATVVVMNLSPLEQIAEGQAPQGEINVMQLSAMPSLEEWIEEAVTPARIGEVKTITAFNELLSSSFITDAKELYSSMSNEQLHVLHDSFLEMIGTSVPQERGVVSDGKRAYSSESEKSKRFEVFANNVLSVMIQNAEEYKENTKTRRARFGITVHADWTREEFLKTRLNMKATNHSYIEKTKRRLEQVDKPMDLALCGQVYGGPVRNQGQCGSCWAYTTAQQLRYQTYAKYHADPGFMSAQFLIDCWPSDRGKHCADGDDGCCGGLPYEADQWLQKVGGMPTKATYGPSLSMEDPNQYYPCRLNVAKAVRPYGGPYQYQTEYSIASAMCEKGPIAIAIAADPLQHYTGGVLTQRSCPANQIDHAVLYVGYDPGESVHIILNSWGSAWGVQAQRPYKHVGGTINGHFLLEYGQNACNVRYLATSPGTVLANVR